MDEVRREITGVLGPRELGWLCVRSDGNVLFVFLSGLTSHRQKTTQGCAPVIYVVFTESRRFLQLFSQALVDVFDNSGKKSREGADSVMCNPYEFPQGLA